MTTDEESGFMEESRRSVMKKGALATGAVALGLGASTGTAAAQQERILVFAYDYYPQTPFSVEASLQQSTTVDLLNGPNDQGIDEISQPDDYNGYVVRYRLSGNQGAGIYALLFTQQSLNTGSTLRLGTDASVFSTDLNLLAANRASGGGGGGGGNDGNGNN